MKNTSEQDNYIVAILIVILLAFIAAILSGCNSLYGLGADMQQITKGYTVVEHKRPSPSQ